MKIKRQQGGQEYRENEEEAARDIWCNEPTEDQIINWREANDYQDEQPEYYDDEEF